MGLFNKIASLINDDDSIKSGKDSYKVEVSLDTPEISPNISKSKELQFTTAIDKRAFVINEFIKEFRDATGTDSEVVEDLSIIVVQDNGDDDLMKYSWVGKRFEDDLRREFRNAFLDKIGSKSLQVLFKPRSEVIGLRPVIEDQVYYQWGKVKPKTEVQPEDIIFERRIAKISILEGTGSMDQLTYIIDPDKKKVFHIGRGVSSRKGGRYRINDIVIKDTEADKELMECNRYVSSSHADIVIKENKFYLKAALGGCRATGGSPTKIIRDERAIELRDSQLLYSLEDGDMIELGKCVMLIFSHSEESSLSDASESDDSQSVPRH
ncbi:MAG: hypothetical protein K2K97_02105 [Muribaculaceae bacterium]|nr:hypothetical protein [Muribaculaceae bacterium]